MKYFKSSFLTLLLFFSLISLAAFKGIDNPVKKGEITSQECNVVLFDADNFEENSITLEGANDYANLTDLPDAGDKNWSGAVRSVMVGENTTLTVWPEEDFQGEPTEFESGSYPSVGSFMSIKIKCSL